MGTVRYLCALVLARLSRGNRRGFDVIPHPFEKGRKIGYGGVAARMLPPRQFTADQLIHRRHGVLEEIAGRAKILFTEQSVNRPREDGGHEAAVRVDPFGIARFYA